MEVLFPILFIVVAAAILVFLIVAVRSFLTSKGQKPFDIDNERRSGPDLSRFSTSDHSSFSDSDKPSPGDAFGGGGDFGGGGSGGSFADPEVGGSLVADAPVSGDDFGDSGGDAGDSGGGSGDGGSGE